MRLLTRFAAGAALLLMAMGAPLAAQERSAVKQGFELPANSQKRILLFRPSVRAGALSTGGMYEPNAEWTQQAVDNIGASLAELQARMGNQIIVAPEAYGDGARLVDEHLALFSAVSDAVINYQFFVGNRLPTKKKEINGDVFDWSLGTRVAELPGAESADYGLFIVTKDAYGSTGRKLLQIAAMLGPRIAINAGEHIGYAGLVDLRTGDLLWLNADGEMGGDVRDLEGSRKRVQQLLEDFPGSDIRAE